MAKKSNVFLINNTKLNKKTLNQLFELLPQTKQVALEIFCWNQNYYLLLCLPNKPINNSFKLEELDFDPIANLKNFKKDFISLNSQHYLTGQIKNYSLAQLSPKALKKIFSRSKAFDRFLLQFLKPEKNKISLRIFVSSHHPTRTEVLWQTITLAVGKKKINKASKNSLLNKIITRKVG